MTYPVEKDGYREADTMRQKIFRLAEQIAEDQGVELFDIELLGKGKLLLRVYIDKEGGVTLDECERFSKGLGILLDVENPIPGSYTLEVSSPGLNRPLRNLKDYEKNAGKLARIITKEKIDNQNFFVGRIAKIDDGILWLRVGEHDVQIPLTNISRASLEIEV
jgi:ribosome maturation factor RimP